MFRKPNFTNLRITVRQAVNPYIQRHSNNCFGIAAVPLSTAQLESKVNLPKKLLDKNIKLRNQPTTDMVVLSHDVKTENTLKTKKDNGVTRGRSVKNVLNKYFDNDNIDTDFQKDKKANLKQLVKEFEREQYRKYKAPRKKAEKLMNEDAVAKYKMIQQDILDEEYENRKFYELYLNQFEGWDDFFD